MKRMLFCVLLAGIIGAGSGCASIKDKDRVKPQPVSKFIKNPKLLVKQKNSFPFHYFYIKPNAGTYENVYIAPVNTEYLVKNTNWAKLDQNVANKLQCDIGAIADFAKTTYEKAFSNMTGSKHLKVVKDNQKPKTLVVSLAIVGIVPSKAELTILGTAGNVFLPGIGIIANKIAAGSVTLECMISDAQTGEIIAMYANTERDQRAVLNVSGMTWYNSTKRNIEKEAEVTAKIFSGQDYSEAQRSLIKLIAI